jgi:predicted nucleic-acid-binding protein
MIGLDTNVLVRYLRFEDEDRIRLAISALRRGADLSDENSNTTATTRCTVP